jgi:biopolymer transport protein ExbB/TolQ
MFMWPLVTIAVVVVGLGVAAAVRIGQTEGADPVLETGIDATLFWGGWALLLGLLGTFGGIYQAAGAIEQAGAVSAQLVWGGIKVALITTLFGLTIFIVASVIWFGLRTWYRRTAMV